ncbi:N-acetylmuramoyl-L-alanine amidase-like [Pholidichthys leucotaenia]
MIWMEEEQRAQELLEEVIFAFQWSQFPEDVQHGAGGCLSYTGASPPSEETFPAEEDPHSLWFSFFSRDGARPIIRHDDEGGETGVAGHDKPLDQGGVPRERGPRRCIPGCEGFIPCADSIHGLIDGGGAVGLEKQRLARLNCQMEGERCEGKWGKDSPAVTPPPSLKKTELLGLGDSLPSAVLRIPDYLVPETPVKKRRNTCRRKRPASPMTALLLCREQCSAPFPEELEEHQERRGDVPKAVGEVQCQENRVAGEELPSPGLPMDKDVGLAVPEEADGDTAPGTPSHQSVHLRNMESFIQAVQQVEQSNPGLCPLALVRALRRTAGHDDMMTIHFLGASQNLSDVEDLQTAILNASSFSFFDKAIHHIVTDHGEERGVVLTPDGTTVALAPLLLGIESGLKTKLEGSAAAGIFPLTLGRILGLSFLSLQDFPPSHRLGPNGCWDSVKHPKVFKLSLLPTLATDAIISGGMDGLILGTDLSNLMATKEVPALSEVLKGYYTFSLHEEQGLDTVTSHISPRRRELSRSILKSHDIHSKVMETLALVWKLEKTEWIAHDTGIGKAVKDGLQAFVHKYWDCPQIIPRCQWGAKPHRGTPIPLSLPLQFLYVHHTYEPSSPCLSFPACSHNMRAMQRFHQEDRNWADIGYSFVVGSDGYIYEGRGWNHLGTHTRGHNSIGYGVSIIGNYTSTVPSRYAVDLLRHHLAQCAVDGGRLVANFTIHGHRQAVNYTACPGDAFFTEIRSWEHFRE